MMTLRRSGSELHWKSFENSIVVYVFFINFLTKFTSKFIASTFESNTTILWGFYKCPSPRLARPTFEDASIRHCPPRHKKHAENVTVYLQCSNRLNGKDAAGLGKQVLMFDEKTGLKICVQSLSHCNRCSGATCKPLTPPSLRILCSKV